MEAMKTKAKAVSVDDSDHSDRQGNPAYMKTGFKKKRNNRHGTQMSVIPEKKEETDVSPSLVEIDRKRKQDKMVSGFKIQVDPANMTRTELIKK